MLLIFRMFRNFKNPNFYEFVNKTNKNEITYDSTSSSNCKNLLTFLGTCYQIKLKSFIENNPKIDETSVIHLMEKSITKRRRRRTNLCQKIIVNIKKRKRYKVKMQNFWRNEAELSRLNFASQQELSFATEAKSYSDVVKSGSLLHSKGTNLKQFLADVRYDLYTPYGQWLKNSWRDDRAKNGCLFKVASYNILAPGLIDMHSNLYEKNDQRFLEWEYRKLRLIEEIKIFDADILCLQEVQHDKLDFFDSQLRNLGYVGIFKKRTNDKIDGCAIYYRTNKFVLREQTSVEFHQPNVFLLNRDNVALIVRLSPKNQTDKCIVIANTHLLFNPNRNDIKLAQSQMLLAEIDRIAYKCFHNTLGTLYHPVVLSGDFNVRPFSPVYQLLNDGYVDNICETFRNRRFNNNSNPNELMPVQFGVTDGCQHHDVVLHRTPVRSGISDFKYVRLFNSDRKSLSAAREHATSRREPFHYELFGSGSLYHNLRLNSVYPHYDVQNATTYQDSWINVDYMFYGPFKAESYEKIDGELKLVSYLKCPDKKQAEILENIPNEECGSDHLPLVATFHLPNDA